MCAFLCALPVSKHFSHNESLGCLVCVLVCFSVCTCVREGLRVYFWECVCERKKERERENLFNREKRERECVCVCVCVCGGYLLCVQISVFSLVHLLRGEEE